MSSYRWYLSAAALREYAAIGRLPLDDGGPLWGRAERLLGAACAQAHHVRDEPGRQIWRVGSMHSGISKKLEFTVSVAIRPEGPLPQLVRVRSK